MKQWQGGHKPTRTKFPMFSLWSQCFPCDFFCLKIYNIYSTTTAHRDIILKFPLKLQSQMQWSRLQTILRFFQIKICLKHQNIVTAFHHNWATSFKFYSDKIFPVLEVNSLRKTMFLIFFGKFPVLYLSWKMNIPIPCSPCDVTTLNYQ